MTENITRKEFLRLAAAATASTALAGRSSVAQDAVPEDAAVPEDPAGTQPRTLIRGADVLTMDPTLSEQLATDVLVDNGRIVAVGKGLAADGAEAIEAIFAARSTEQEWNTAARLQTDLFGDGSAPLQLALGPVTWPGHRIDGIEDEWARIRSTGVELLVAHLHKPGNPHPEGFMGHRDSGIPDLHEAGLLGPDYHVAHANRLTAQELEMLRDTGGMIAATTMSEYSFMMQAHRGPSVHGRARAAGVPVGIGIDVPLALPGDYFEHVRSSLWSHYLEEESRQIVQDYRSEDTLDFATAMGARAIRLGDETGSIAVGKRADLKNGSSKKLQR